MAEEKKVYENKWKLGLKYYDMSSHFLRMDAKAVEQYFNAREGVFVGWGHSPNWLENTEEGYELVRMDGDEVASRTGIFLTLGKSPALDTAVVRDLSRGKTVAYWNYHLVKNNVNEPDDSIKISSDDFVKGIVAYADGSIYANACRFTRSGSQLLHKSQFLLQSIDGLIPHTPFVNLAFFMWIEETDEGKEVLQWLVNNMQWGANATE